MRRGELDRTPAPGTAPAGRATPASSRSRSRPGRAIAPLVILTLALLLAGTARGDLPEGTITDVKIEGNSTISTEKIRALLLSRPGKPLDGATVDKDIRSLNNKSWFSPNSVKAFFEKDPAGEGFVLIFQVAEMPVLTHVEFRGLEKLSKKDVEENTGLKVGARADSMRTRLAVKQIQRLYEEKGYEFAQVDLLEGGEAGDTRVVMQIFEGPKAKVGSVHFEGNTFASDAVLLTKIASRPKFLGLLSGKYHRDALEEDIRKLIEYYQNNGFFDVEVSPVSRPGASLGDREVTFVISEGVQYTVRDIIFEGNEKLTEEQLRDGLALHSNVPFNDNLREADRKAIETKYFQIGCIDTRILPEPRYVNERGVIDLLYRIEEGKPYILGQLIVKGNARTRDKVIRREADMAGLLPGEPLDPTRIELYRKRLGNLRYFQSSPEMGKLIDIKVVNRRSRDQPYGDVPLPSLNGISLTRMQGPDLLPLPSPPEVPDEPLAPGPGPAEVVPFGFGPAPGELPPIAVPPPLPGGPEVDTMVDPAAGPQGLASPPVGAGVPPGLFPNLPASNMNDPGPDRQDPFAGGRDYADIVTQVDEAPTGNFMFGVGASSYGGLQGTISVTERNFDIFNVPRSWSDLTSGQAFRGAGQNFQLLFSPGTRVNRIMASFGDPYLFDLPIGFNSQGYVFQRVYPNWTEDRGGGRFSLGRQFGTQTYADVAFRVEDVNFYAYRNPAPADYLAASGHTLLYSLRPSLRFDNRNDPYAPNKGQYLEFAFEQGWGNFTFPKVTVEGRQYFTLGSRPDGTGKRLLKLRGYFGATGPDTPVYERFFAGDFLSLRGFAFRGVGPHVLGVNVGGLMTALGSVEYQVPLLANDQLHGVVFSDFGTVSRGYDFEQIRVTVGTGLRINIPQFGPYPLAFDLGFPLAKEPGDRTRVFAFFVGVF